MGKYGRGHIGKTFNDGKITVVDGGDKEGYVKVKCSVCAEDTELFGNAIFEKRVDKLKEGKLPCGCSGNVLWTMQQYEVHINRKIKTENLPVKFIGFEKSAKNPARMVVKLFCCRSESEYSVIGISNFLCGVGNSGNTGKSWGELPSFAERLIKYNKDNPNYVVWNSKKKYSHHVLCGFYCKVCEANNLESLFEIPSNNLFAGSLPCYCGNSKKNISGDYVIDVSKNFLHNQYSEGISVLGAYSNGRHWYTVFLCETHGVYSRPYNKLNSTGCRCLKCTPPCSGYSKVKIGYLYVLDIQTPAGCVLGYGVTNRLNRRTTTHHRNIKSIGATITNIQVFEGSGTAVLAVENDIKSLHTTGLLDCEGFRRESISIDMKDEVLEKCKKLKELDNVDKLI